MEKSDTGDTFYIVVNLVFLTCILDIYIVNKCMKIFKFFKLHPLGHFVFVLYIQLLFSVPR